MNGILIEHSENTNVCMDNLFSYLYEELELEEDATLEMLISDLVCETEKDQFKTGFGIGVEITKDVYSTQ